MVVGQRQAESRELRIAVARKHRPGWIGDQGKRHENQAQPAPACGRSRNCIQPRTKPNQKNARPPATERAAKA